MLLLEESPEVRYFTGSSAGPANLCMVSWVTFQQEGNSETEAVAIIPDEKSFMTFGTSRLLD